MLPGGFFFLEQPVGRSSYAERVGAIMVASFAPALFAAARVLPGLRSGSLLVVGIDSAGLENEGDDQICVAFNANGIVGLARKVFPTKNERPSLILPADDFGHPRRLVPFPDATKALLCACYDAVGIPAPERRISTVWRLRVDGRVVSRAAAARHLRRGRFVEVAAHLRIRRGRALDRRALRDGRRAPEPCVDTRTRRRLRGQAGDGRKVSHTRPGRGRHGGGGGEPARVAKDVAEGEPRGDLGP